MRVKRNLAAMFAASTIVPAAAQERGLKKVPVPAAPTHPTLAVRATSTQGGKAAPLAPGGELRSGDLVEFYTYVSEPAYLYALQFHPDGTATLLYPDPADAIRTVGETRIPEQGSSFQLDGEPGDEKVFFVASSLPLIESDRQLSEAVNRVRALSTESAATPPAAKPSTSVPPSKQASASKPPRQAGSLPPPAEFGLATRGRLIKVRTGPAGPADGVAAGDDGIAIFQFTIRHLAPGR